jgi:hypothetical protein
MSQFLLINSIICHHKNKKLKKSLLTNNFKVCEMSNYIKNPMSHQEWNPTMGDFFSQRVFEEDRLYEKKQKRQKILISSLISLHIILLTAVVVYLR